MFSRLVLEASICWGHSVLLTLALVASEYRDQT